MSGTLTRRSALAAGGAVSLTGTTRLGPQRIVSLNPCLDAILVHVADRDQITALSHYSHSLASSSLGELGLSYPFTYGTAEEVLALVPDLVLSGRLVAPATQAALTRLGIPMALFGAPDSLSASLAQVTEVARIVHRPTRGAALEARILAAIEAAKPAPRSHRLTALIYQSGGFAVARGTLMDEMMTLAGFENAASRYGLARTGNVPLENLIADPPDVLLAAQGEPGQPTWADRVLTHPALSKVAHRMHRVVFPQQLTFCGGPVLIATAAMLARARVETLAARR